MIDGTWIANLRTNDGLIDVDCTRRRARMIAAGIITPNRWSPGGPTWWPWIDKPTLRLRGDEVIEVDPAGN